MKKLIIVLCLLAAPVYAFDGFPLAENTNAHYWPRAVEMYNPVSQVWYSAAQRYLIEPPDDEYDGASEILRVYAGTSNQVLTNASGSVYTNTYTRTTNFLHRLGFGISTTNWTLEPVVYTWSDGIVTNTSTAHPYYSGAPIHNDWMRAYIEYAIFESQDDDWDRTCAERYVCTNVMVNGRYNVYFATADGDGDYPREFLFNSKAGLMDREHFGKTTYLQTNNWGHVAGPDYVTYGNASREFWTYMATGQISRVLGQANYTTSGWSYSEGSVYCTNPFVTWESNAAATLVYLPAGTNTSTTFTVTVLGWEIIYGSQTNNGYFDRRYTNENVTISGAGASTNALTSEWSYVTSITGSAPPNVSDTLMVRRTNAVAIYYDGEKIQSDSVAHYLYPEHFDELWRAFRAMTHTSGQISWDPSPAVSNYYHWSGAGAGSWAVAKSNCEAATPTITSSALAPEAWTRGRLIAGSYYADAYARACIPKVTNRMDWQSIGNIVGPELCTNFIHYSDFYVLSLPPSNAVGMQPVYDAGGFPLTNQIMVWYDTAGPDRGGGQTGTVVLGQTTFPTNAQAWCAEPTNAAGTSRGWTVPSLAQSIPGDWVLVCWTNELEHQ
jgi:hypothetical protein